MHSRIGILSLLTGLALGVVLQAPASGQVRGEVAIIGIQSDIPDRFAWVTLVDLTPGTVLHFTDQGVIGGQLQGARTVTDGTLSFTVPAGGLPAGHVELVDLSLPLPPAYRRVDDGSGTFLLGKFGDQIAIYRARGGEPEYLFGLNTNASTWGVTSPEPNPVTESELYPGLISGFGAVAVGAGPIPGQEVDNCAYRGPTRGSVRFLRVALSDPRHWDCSDEPIEDLTGGTLETGFTISSAPLEIFRRADVNEDDDVDISDAINNLAYQFLGTFDLECLDAGDVNDDGIVDVTDPLTLLSYLFLGTAAPPAPFGACGPDPTADTLNCEQYDDC